MKPILKILIAEDTKTLRFLAQHRLEELLGDFCIPKFHTFECAEDALRHSKSSEVDIAILDIDFSKSSESAGMTGLEASKFIKEFIPSCHTCVISSHESQDVMERAKKEFQVDWFVRRSSQSAFQELAWLCQVRLLGKLHARGELVEKQYHILSSSPLMAKTLLNADRILPDQRILIQGSTGTGKELLAQRITSNARFLTRDTARPFVALDCSALAQEIVESELFGHGKGAFTGAIHDKIGHLEKANGGDLFLDEIHNLPLSIQKKLLRVLNDGVFETVGGSRKVKSVFRIIAATNQDVEESIAKGLLLEDFVARIRTRFIKIPTLKQRPEDIEPLIQHTLKKNQNFDKEFSLDAINFLKEQSWPRNVRQLVSIVERAISEVSVPIVTREYLEPLLESGAKGLDTITSMHSSDMQSSNIFQESLSDLIYRKVKEGGTLDDIRNEIERIYFKHMMDINSNISFVELADKTGISRPTLRKKLQFYGLHTVED